MRPDESVFGLVDFRSQKGRTAQVGMDRLHDPPVRVADLRFAGAGLKAKNLVSLLLCHRARSRRAAMPRCRVSLQVFTPDRVPALPISL